MVRLIDVLRHGEEGHAQTLPGLLSAVVGAVLLGIGAANDTGWLAIVGGIALAVGLVLAQVAHHAVIDYDLFRRVGTLEEK